MIEEMNDFFKKEYTAEERADASKWLAEQSLKPPMRVTLC